MRQKWPWPLVCVGLGANLACESEVSLHLFKTGVGANGPKDAGTGGTRQARRDADTKWEGGRDASPAAREAGRPPDPPCEKLGTEVCNGGDDDCNGTTDERCDYTVVWTREPDKMPIGHVTGGVTIFEPCPDGAVLTGLRVGFGSWLNQVSAICRQIALSVDTTSSVPRFSAVLGPRKDTPLAPATSTDSKNRLQDLTCPSGSVLSGVDGTTTDDIERYILGIRITCAPPTVTTTANAPAFDSDRAQEVTAGPIVCGACSMTQGYNFSTTVSGGHIATGLFGSVGLRVDRVGVGESAGSIRVR
jgi:hypothetical protein